MTFEVMPFGLPYPTFDVVTSKVKVFCSCNENNDGTNKCGVM